MLIYVYKRLNADSETFPFLKKEKKLPSEGAACNFVLQEIKVMSNFETYGKGV